MAAATSRTALLRTLRGPELTTLGTLATALVTLVVALGAVVAYQHVGAFSVVAVVCVLVVCVWLFAAASPVAGAAVILAYLALGDGFLRLYTGRQEITLLRDALLYALAAGLLARIVVERRRLHLPPLGGLVALVVGIVAVEFAHPLNGTLPYSLAAARSHLEWIPLFYIGYALIRDVRLLRSFLVLLVTVAAINGAVSAVQFRLSTDQLAAWGPGYAASINGTNGQSQRVYFDSAEKPRTRPFGLGADIGFGGYLGMLAAPALLGLYATGALRRRWLLVPLGLGVALAVVTSQTRSALVGAILAVLAYLFLTTRLRRISAAFAGLVLAAALTGGIVYLLASQSSEDTFLRYRSLAPQELATTSYQYRSFSLRNFIDYAPRYPLGAGLGSAGPTFARAVGGEPPLVGQLDAENEFNHALIELGIPGLAILLVLTIRVLGLTGRLKYLRDSEAGIYLAAIAAPVFALLVSWIGFAVMAKPPTAPYFWFAAGILAFWLGRRPLSAASGALSPTSERVDRAVRPPPSPASRLSRP